MPTKVFVADANSTDNTADIALAYRPRLDVTVIPGGMPSVGRNQGARASDSKYILFLDADVALHDATMISACIRRMKSNALHCATVNVRCTSERFADRFLYGASNVMQKLSTWHKPFGTGMFLLVERKRFEAIGGFCEEALFAEDYHFTRQISPLRFAVLPGAIHTSNRRFERTGHIRMISLFLQTALQQNRPTHFQRDHGYWQHEKN